MSNFKKIFDKIAYEHIVLAIGILLTSIIIVTAH